MEYTITLYHRSNNIFIKEAKMQSTGCYVHADIMEQKLKDFHTLTEVLEEAIKKMFKEQS